jgi:WLM domain
MDIPSPYDAKGVAEMTAFLWCQYSSIRRVLLHELAHNVHGEHELPFKELDSAHVKHIVAFEKAKTKGKCALPVFPVIAAVTVRS